MFTCTKAVHHVKHPKNKKNKLFSVCCLHYNSSTHCPKGHGLRSDTGCCACLCGWIEECVINTHAAAVHLSSCLKMSKKPYLHGVEMGKGSVIDSDVWSCCCKRGVRRWMQPWNESEIMILASLQFRKHRNLCLHVLSLFVCSEALQQNMQWDMGIPSCRSDLQVSHCASAWPAVKLGNEVLFKNKG